MDQHDLAGVLGRLAVDLHAESDAESTLRGIVDGSIAIIPGAQRAGVSLSDGRSVEARVPSDGIVAELEALQADLGDGPCAGTVRETGTVHIRDTRTDDWWPRFSRAAAERGIRSLMSFQLLVGDKHVGALNLYSSVPDAFDEEAETVGTIVAQHASVALSAVIADAQFTTALNSRDLIGQAKGLLMARNDVTGLKAFQMLVKASQHTNTKLTEIARLLVEEHEQRSDG